MWRDDHRKSTWGSDSQCPTMKSFSSSPVYYRKPQQAAEKPSPPAPWLFVQTSLGVSEGGQKSSSRLYRMTTPSWDQKQRFSAACQISSTNCDGSPVAGLLNRYTVAWHQCLRLDNERASPYTPRQDMQLSGRTAFCGHTLRVLTSVGKPFGELRKPSKRGGTVSGYLDSFGSNERGCRRGCAGETHCSGWQ